MRRWLLGIVVALAVGITAGAGITWAQALNYEGEDSCREHPAWPNGTYLGQMHPYHQDFYTRYAEKRGWDPCETWADDQRASAIRGLRALGYTVTAPTTPTPTPQPVQGPTIPSDLQHAYHLIRHAVASSPELLQILDHPRALSVRVRWDETGTLFAPVVYFHGANVITVNRALLGGERPEVLASMLAHEFHHAATVTGPRSSGETCLEIEREATEFQIVVWSALRPADAPASEYEVMLDGIAALIGSPEFDTWLRDAYEGFCLG